MIIMRVMFTGGGGAGNEAIWRLLGHRYTLFFADANIEAICPNIPEDRRILIPMANAEYFEESIQAACKDKMIDIIVPGVDEELMKLAGMKNKDGWPMMMLPDADFIGMMLDKLACADALRNNGFDAPLTRSVINAEEIGFPMIIKPRSGRGSRGVMKITESSQIPAYVTLHQADPDAIIVQELICGQEYTVFVLADAWSNLRAVVPVKVAEKRGITISAEIENNEVILEFVQRFHAVFKPSGPYNIQCMFTRGGRIVPFEINPRISTTLCMSVFAGIDIIDLFTKNNNHAPLVSFAQNVKLRRFWNNSITRKEVS